MWHRQISGNLRASSYVPVRTDAVREQGRLPLFSAGNTQPFFRRLTLHSPIAAMLWELLFPGKTR